MNFNFLDTSTSSLNAGHDEILEVVKEVSADGGTINVSRVLFEDYIISLNDGSDEVSDETHPRRRSVR